MTTCTRRNLSAPDLALEALSPMMDHAEALEAHAIIGMRYDATEVMQGAIEVLAYGTAVRLESAR